VCRAQGSSRLVLSGAKWCKRGDSVVYIPLSLSLVSFFRLFLSSERSLLDHRLAVWMVGRIFVRRLGMRASSAAMLISLGGMAWFGADDGRHTEDPIGLVVELLYSVYGCLAL